MERKLSNGKGKAGYYLKVMKTSLQHLCRIVVLKYITLVIREMEIFVAM